MGRFHNTQDGKVAFTPEEEIARDAKEAAYEIARPLRKWKDEISATDKDMPRWLENHLEADHGGITSNPFTQAKYDSKKEIRSRKPTEE